MFDLRERSNRTKTPDRPSVWRGLRKLSAADVVRVNASQAVPASFFHDVGKQKIKLQFPSRQVEQREVMCADVMVGDAALKIYASPVVVNALLKVKGYDQDLSVVNPKVASMVLEHLLAPHMSHCEEIFAGPFRVRKVFEVEAVPPTATLGFDISALTRTERQIGIEAEPETVAMITGAFFETQGKTVDQSLNPMVSCRTAPISMLFDDLRELWPGDGLRLPDAWNPDGIDEIWLSQFQRAAAQKTDDGVQIDGPFVNVTPDHKLHPLKGALMSDPANINVEISVEVARQRFSLDQLGDLAQGHILPFTQPVSKSVRLYSDEHPVAEGELVELDSGYGVHILKLL